MNKNKKITKIEFEKAKKLTLKTSENSLTICDVEFSYYHEQDCCESVYADFSSIEGYVRQLKELYEIKSLEVVGVEDIGFLLIVEGEYGSKVSMLINCYNSQNGYYSDELDLFIKHNGVETKYDLTESGFIQHDIC